MTLAENIFYTITRCMLGNMLVAKTTKGVCAVLLDNDVTAMIADLHTRFPQATHTRDDKAVKKDAAKIVRYMEKPEKMPDVTLDMRGTDFQKRVWKALRAIPAGKTATYKDIAIKLKMPKAARAVGGACAINPVSILVPCHRVLGSNGRLTGYYWGTERKRTLLQHEGAL